MCVWGGSAGIVDAEGVGGGWADGDDARPKFDADGDIVVRGEAAFAQADCELGVGYYGVRMGCKDGARHTLDLPQPESPRDTILAM